MVKEIGTVKIVTGTVTAIASDGSKRILQVGDKVYPTDLLTTADGSTVMIELVNGSFVDMGGNDSMQLGAALEEQDAELQLAQNQTPAGQTVEEIQAALLAGEDPTKIADPTAAGAAGGAGAGNEGHPPVTVVTVEYLNPVAPVTNGFDTIGPNAAFTPIIPEVLILNPNQAAAVSGNQAPIAGDDAVRGVAPGSPVTIDILGNDNDPDGTLNPATVQIVGSTGPGQPVTVPNEGTWTVNTGTGAITFTPNPGFTGNPTPISYTVSDNQGLPSNPATVTVGYNQPPVATSDSQLGNTPGTAVTINVLGNDSDPDGTLNPASVQLAGSTGPGQPVTVPNEGTWTVNTTTGAITFTPNPGFTGNPTPISYTVSDNQGLPSNPATVTVGYNQPPVAASDSQLGNTPGSAATISVLGNDSDPDGSLNPASVQIVGSTGPGQPVTVPNEGTWTVNTTTGAITFTPNPGFTGNPTPISYTVSDNQGLPSNPATVTVGYNQPPVATSDSQLGNTPGTAVTINVLGNDSDSDGSLNPASVQLAGSTGPGQPLTVPNEGTWTVNTTTGAITFTPNPGFTGNPTPISYTVSDNQGLPSNPATVTVGYNQPPLATSDSQLGNTPGSAVTISVLGNDSDPDGSLNPASVQIVGSTGPGQPMTVPNEGTWTVNTGTGAITFTPDPGFQGSPTPINYTVADSQGLVSNPATVEIGYLPVASASVVIVDESEASANVLPSETGTLLINGQAPTSVVLAATGATWNSTTQTLTATDGSYKVEVSNGAYTFTLLEALPHAAGTQESTAIDFTFSATLFDQNGNTANTTFTASVFDDGPTVSNNTGSIRDVAGQTLSGLIDYNLGFDGYGGIKLEDLNGRLTSRSDTVTIKIFDSNNDGFDELYAFVDKGTQTTRFEDLAGDRMVFSLTPTTGDRAVDGDYKLVMQDVLDMPSGSPVNLTFDGANRVSSGQFSVGSVLVEGNNLFLDSNSNHIGVNNDSALDRGEVITFKFGTLVNAVQLSEFNVDQIGPDRFTWTAYRDDVAVGSRSNVVAPLNGGNTPVVNVNGGYDTLRIEVTSGKFEVGGLKYTPLGAQTLPLNFGFVATDGDGDSVTGNFTVDTGALLNTNLTPVSPDLQHPDSVVH